LNKKIVVIPTYNEKENIESILLHVMQMDSTIHVLVVDDNSPDGTGQIVKDIASNYKGRIFILERLKKDGLGRAYVAGFDWCLQNKYSYIAEMDADFSHNPDDLNRLYEALEKGAEVAIGSRYKTGINVVNWDIKRVLMSYFASRYVRFVTGLPIHDSTAGFVAYTASALEKINVHKIKFKGYAFQIEMKYRAWIKGLKLEEVPIIFTDRSKGVSKMSMGIFREAFLGVIELKLRKIFRRL
jgi:dolichol-phosphate mannosyltransferase